MAALWAGWLLNSKSLQPGVSIVPRKMVINAKQKTPEIKREGTIMPFDLPISASALCLGCIADPQWSPWEDHYILQARKVGKPFSIIAGELGANRVSVMQRYQLLCAVPDVENAIEEYGLSEHCYWDDGCGLSTETFWFGEKPSLHIGRPSP